MYERLEIPANGAIPAFAFSVTSRKQVKVANPGSIPVSATNSFIIIDLQNRRTRLVLQAAHQRRDQGVIPKRVQVEEAARSGYRLSRRQKRQADNRRKCMRKSHESCPPWTRHTWLLAAFAAFEREVPHFSVWRGGHAGAHVLHSARRAVTGSTLVARLAGR